MTEDDLKSLFCQFESYGPVQYRLLAGRMRGQAFVTFKGQKSRFLKNNPTFRVLTVKTKSKLGFYIPFNSQGHIWTGPQ